MGQALSAVSARDAHSFFEHAGYRPVGQLLSNVLPRYFVGVEYVG